MGITVHGRAGGSDARFGCVDAAVRVGENPGSVSGRWGPRGLIGRGCFNSSRPRRFLMAVRLRLRPPVSLFWRLLLVNAALVAGAAAVLAFSPLTVSSPVRPGQALSLLVGVVLLVVANGVVLRRSLAPLQRLVRLMRSVDLLLEQERPPVTGPGEVAALLQGFNEMLDRLEQERRTSAARALMAQEEERRRIAHELHDEIGQQLTSLLLQLKTVIAATPPELRDELELAREITREALDQLRQIASDLRPDTLAELGLVSALRALTSRIGELAPLQVERTLPDRLPPLSHEQELVLYRVAQESLTNVIRHAQASRVVVSIALADEAVLLAVIDDGLGVNGAREAGGIRGMRERALLVGGQLELYSPAEGGTRVVLRVPLGVE
jgi:two-component system sensor histidine kinase UhpB